MPKATRLTHDELKNIRGKRLQGALFSLLYAPLSGRSSRAAVVVSKKVAAKAVVRNTLKRRARAALQKTLPSLKRPLTLVFQAKQGAAGAPSGAITRDIEALIERASRAGY